MTTILLVDDEVDLLWSVELSLRAEGYQVEIAHNGIEALMSASRTPPDLIVLDISMPRLDGWQVCASLRNDPLLCHVPLIFLSGHDSIEDRLRGFEEGADDYLTKPFDLRELRARIKALLRRKGHEVPEKPSQRGMLSVGSLRLDLHTCDAIVEGRRIQLTPAEVELMRFLMEHPDEVFSTHTLLKQVWGYPPESADPSLVRWHMMNLRAKIESDPTQPLWLRTVPRHGYMLRSQAALVAN